MKHTFITPISHGLTDIFGGWAEVVGIVVAVAAGALFTFLVVRRRSRIASRGAEAQPVATSIDPATLEIEADRRATTGEFAAALRLRFEAGLLRLEAAGLVTNQLVHTDAEVAARIGSPTFDLLVERHQAVAYAGDQASAADVEHARTSWPRVSDEARAHRTLTKSG